MLHGSFGETRLGTSSHRWLCYLACYTYRVPDSRNYLDLDLDLDVDLDLDLDVDLDLYTYAVPHIFIFFNGIPVCTESRTVIKFLNGDR